MCILNMVKVPKHEVNVCKNQKLHLQSYQQMATRCCCKVAPHIVHLCSSDLIQARTCANVFVSIKKDVIHPFDKVR